MDDEKQPDERDPGWHSRSADAAAARYGEKHPDADPEHPAPSHVPEPEDEVPNRHSASAEAARCAGARSTRTRSDGAATRRRR
jgi:hypothetical protein